MQKEENRICQKCKKDFLIESEDFAFYEKIKVPARLFVRSVDYNVGLFLETSVLFIRENVTGAGKVLYLFIL